MTLRPWLALSVLFLIACDPIPAAVDAPTDDMTDAPMPSIDAPGHEGGVCAFDDGYTTCMMGYGTTCCGGLSSTFADGPCFPSPPRDAAPMCPEGAYPGCPCDEEGARACPTGGWRLDCEGGVWRERTSYMCCP